MPIKSDLSGVLKQLKELPSKLDHQLIGLLIQAGETAVSQARSSKTYQDQTGNLTASIGYGVFKGNTLIASGGFDYGKEGGNVGAMALLEKLPNLGSSGLGLVVVAGMDYATYVERTGHVVLDNARLNMSGVISNLLSQLKL